jgi:hypothetical protein
MNTNTRNGILRLASAQAPGSRDRRQLLQMLKQAVHWAFKWVEQPNGSMKITNDEGYYLFWPGEPHKSGQLDWYPKEGTPCVINPSVGGMAPDYTGKDQASREIMSGNTSPWPNPTGRYKVRSR